ncbi:MAG: GGDEF domain-containing protein, partial [Pseudomonadota bacterium]
VLLRFVETMNSNIRTGDGFFRFGGEEFILLLPEHDEAEGLEVARKIHQRVSGVVEQSGWTLRYSAGVSGLRPEDTVNTWLMRTDQALYQAKHTGRNQVLCWNQDMLTTPSGLRFDEQAVTDT